MPQMNDQKPVAVPDGIMFSSLNMVQLASMIQQIVRSEVSEALKETTAPAQTEFITRKEAAEILGITLPTLRQYTLKGTLQGYRIGRKVRYKRHEVEDALEAINLFS